MRPDLRTIHAAHHHGLPVGAPPLGACTSCQRNTWSDSELGKPCGMPLPPDGRLCVGVVVDRRARGDAGDLRVRDVARLQLGDGEVLVVTVPTDWPLELIEHARTWLIDHLGTDRVMIIHDPEVALTVVKAEDAPDA